MVYRTFNAFIEIFHINLLIYKHILTALRYKYY